MFYLSCYLHNDAGHWSVEDGSKSIVYAATLPSNTGIETLLEIFILKSYKDYHWAKKIWGGGGLLYISVEKN